MSLQASAPRQGLGRLMVAPAVALHGEMPSAPIRPIYPVSGVRHFQQTLNGLRGLTRLSKRASASGATLGHLRSHWRSEAFEDIDHPWKYDKIY